MTEEGRAPVEIIQTRIDNTIELPEGASTLVETIDGEREFESIDLSTVLGAEVETFEADCPEVAVEAEIPDGIAVKADSLVHQSFANLLHNAVSHNDAGDPTLQVTAGQNETWAEVVVADGGKGIPPEMRETCFELGTQGSESSGDGIGLYLVSRLTDIYGGTVELDESPARGAHFRSRYLRGPRDRSSRFRRSCFDALTSFEPRSLPSPI